MTTETFTVGRARPDFGMVLTMTVLLCGSGLVLLTSASNVVAIRVHDSSIGFTVRQLAAIVIGAAAMAVVMRMSAVHLRWLSVGLAASTLVLLVVVLLIGVEVGGQRNWIPLALGFNLQPSELAKPSIAMLAALLLTLGSRLSWPRWQVLGSILTVHAVVLVLVALEKDTGNLIVLGGISLATLAVAGMRPRHLLGLTAFAVVGLAAVTLAGPDYRLDRFRAWLNPEAYASSDGYQLLHGQYALASGGWLGNGLGGSVEKWGALPAPHTDFILAVIGEEAGLLGTMLILGGIGILVWFGYQIALVSVDPFLRMIAVGISTWLGLQTVINVGGVTGLLPITGVPLPFISYGGSSMVPLLASVGILLAIARDNERHRVETETG